jgi:predicted AlkP superfamily phosphohydrolase/phosphomutase
MSKVLVIGLDGVSHSLVESLAEGGTVPNLQELLSEGSFKKMHSVMPTVSSVAWSTYMTGTNPGKHGIYGFIDRQPDTREVYIPLSSHMKCETLWQILGNSGKRVVVINVPVTYPPTPVAGVLISGFLATKVKKATYPREVADVLRGIGYRIDADPWTAREGKMEEFLADLNHTLEKRFQTAFYFMQKEPWDFFQLHVMGTDRINHFLWNVTKYRDEFLAYYRKIDGFLGELRKGIPDSTTLIILSDHGFCEIEQEVDLNFWLSERGYLKWSSDCPASLEDMNRQSRAYSLPPGRIYLEDEEVRHEVKRELMNLRVPGVKKQIVKKVFERQELYSGSSSLFGPDLVAVPSDGFDFKASFTRKSALTGRSPIVGMHTYDDAFVYVRGEELKKETIGIVDIMPTILHLLEISPPSSVDGSSCL